MRGKERLAANQTRYPGITPAHAGKRPDMSCLNCLNWDHPRPCGEKWALRPSPVMALGSPPPMRGKARDFHRGKLNAGITPAHAGKRR